MNTANLLLLILSALGTVIESTELSGSSLSGSERSNLISASSDGGFNMERQTKKQHKNDGSLLVCRNLHLDETTFRAPSLPGPPPYRSRFVTEDVTIGNSNDGDSNNGDTDVSYLLSRIGEDYTLADTVTFRLAYRTNYPKHVKLLGLDYTTDGKGFKLEGANTKEPLDENSPLVSEHSVDPDNFHHLVLKIPRDAYVKPQEATWTDMRHIGVTYGIPSTADKTAIPGMENVEMKVKLIQLCETAVQPNFCAETTLDSYRQHCHECNCQTCHNCGCSEKPPWKHCTEHGKCDHDGCWCHPACVCCSDCEGYSCDCEECCDWSSVGGCSLGGTYAVTGVEPKDGIGNRDNEILVRGYGFFGNAPNITCRLSAGAEDVVVQGYYQTPTSIFCTTPTWDMSSGVDSVDVSVSISLDGGEHYTDTNGNATITLYDCPKGCASGTCPASVCKCPKHYYGPDCSLKCSDCEHGTCGSVSGTCTCSSPGWKGDKCNIECPGGHANPCSGRGHCFATNETAATCFCDVGYWDLACEEECPRDEKGNVCGGAGTCDVHTGVCHCNNGYYGEDCTNACPGMETSEHVPCGGHGICCTGIGVSALYSQCRGKEVGSCACDAGRDGEECEDTYCFEECYGHGQCDGLGRCVCEEGYSGDFCSLQRGQNTSLSYFSFLESSHLVTEQRGYVSVQIVRFGQLDHDCSVNVETRDLTAKAGEDYVGQSKRFFWSSMDGRARTMNFTVLTNNWPEGEESFEIRLTNPLPIGLSDLGSTPVTVVRIGAKSESGSALPHGSVVARIRVRISQPWTEVKPGEEMGEKMKASFVDATLDALGSGITSDRIYLQGVEPTEDDPTKVMLTFDILPPTKSTNGDGTLNVKDASNAFVLGVADNGSALYGKDMEESCPIDVTFKPEIQMVSFGKHHHRHKSRGARIATWFIVLFALGGLGAALYVKRHQVQEGLLRCLARRKFRNLRGSLDDDLAFDREDDDGGVGHTEYAVARSPHVDGLREVFKKKVLQIELT